MKKNILNVMLAICITSFSTVAIAQSKSAKPKTSTTKLKAKAKIQAATPPPPSDPPPMEDRYYPPQTHLDVITTPSDLESEMITRPPSLGEYKEGTEVELFEVAEQQAEFPGGQAAMFKWLAANIKYPAVARENSIEGKVILRCVVEKDGSLSKITVLRGTNELLDKEAVRVVKSMPKWKPGKQRGNDVRSYFTLPVVFKLENIPADKK